MQTQTNLLAQTELNLPESATFTNTIYQVAEARSNSYYTVVFGNYTLTEDLTIANTNSLVITEGSTLIIPAGITLENNGTIVIQAGGTMEGEENGEIIYQNTVTGIESIEGVKVYSKDGSIYVQTPQQMQVMIVTTSGSIVKNETLVGQLAYNLSKGIYIVRVGKQIYKVRN